MNKQDEAEVRHDAAPLPSCRICGRWLMGWEVRRYGDLCVYCHEEQKGNVVNVMDGSNAGGKREDQSSRRP